MSEGIPHRYLAPQVNSLWGNIRPNGREIQEVGKMLADKYKNATILKQYQKDGKEYADIEEVCDRCGGKGVYFVGWLNDHGVPAQPDNGVCYKCSGAGKTHASVRVYTQQEYDRMQAAKQKTNQRKAAELRDKLAAKLQADNVSLLKRMGFEDVVAYAIIGNTYDIKDALKEHGCRYSYTLKWVSPTKPIWLTTHEYVELSADKVFTINDYGVLEVREGAAEYLQSLIPTKGQYVGNIGEKISTVARLAKSYSYNTRFGISNIYTFIDTNGNELTWFTSNSDGEENVVYSLTGTVKGHSEYNNIKQTVLTRCKLKRVGDLDG